MLLNAKYLPKACPHWLGINFSYSTLAYNEIQFGITYFAGAEKSEDPISLKGQTWESIKKIIQQPVKDYLR